MQCNKIEEYLQVIDETIAKGPFQADWASLGQHKTPQWYRKGRFGLFIHWGVYSVPAYASEWYPRLMYLKGAPAYLHHKKVYGGVEKFPYKNFVPQFKAEKFNADEWLDIFQKSGAKYIMPVGEHHDGFKMYKSSLNRWNAAEMGPHRDVLQELHEACDRHGIGFCTSSHRAEHYWFLNGARDFDCDITRGEDADFYGPAHREGTGNKARYSCGENMQPDEAWLQDWLASSAELIDRNRPLAVYFDWWVTQKAFKPYMKKFLAYYYNRAAEWSKEVTVFYKQDGIAKGCATFDVERGQLDTVSPDIWQSDTAIAKNSWGYTEGNKFKTAAEIACAMTDVVSKNGCFMLNVGPKADGTICEEEKQVLLQLGQWLQTCGEAIYDAKPFDVFGESKKKRRNGSFKENFKYTSADIRFTYQPGCIYMFVLNAGNGNTYASKTLARGNDAASYMIRRVTLLGSDAKVTYTRSKKALALTVNGSYDRHMPLCFKIELG